MLKSEWDEIMLDLEHPDPLQQILTALYLFTHLPVYLLARLTPEQINKIAAPLGRVNA